VHNHGIIDFNSTRTEAQVVANNYRSRLVFCLVSITVRDETAALQQNKAARGFLAFSVSCAQNAWCEAWLSRAHHFCRPSTIDRWVWPVRHVQRPTSRYNALGVFSATTLHGRLTGMLQRELSSRTAA